MATPTFTVEAAFGSYPGDATYTWTDISTKARSASYSRGRQHELDRTQAGQGALVLRDETRAFDSTYASSPYYPNVIPMVPVRGKAVSGGTTYYQFLHYVSSWTRNRTGPNYAERSVATVDGFELLAKPLQPAKATVTTALGGNRDITYTAVEPGVNGNNLTVTYVAGKPFGVGMSGSALIIRTGSTGVTANQIITGILAHTEAWRAVTPALALGSDGTGTVTTMGTLSFSGGAALSLPQGLSGAHVASALDSIGWPSALRLLGTGKKTIRAHTFQPGDSVVALEYIQDVCGAGGEEGLVFVDGQGRVFFLDRWAMVSSPYTVSQATFSDVPTGAEIAYQALTPAYDKSLIVNEWTGKRTGEKVQTVVDLPSQLKYLRRAKQLPSLLANDDDLIPTLQLRLARTKDPLDRVESIDVMPGATTTAWQACLAREPGDRVTVKQHPPPSGSAVDSREYFVQSVKADIDYASPVKSKFTFQLWPADVGNWLIFNDVVYGRMDYNRMAA